jgi:hypothetical protein
VIAPARANGRRLVGRRACGPSRSEASAAHRLSRQASVLSARRCKARDHPGGVQQVRVARRVFARRPHRLLWCRPSDAQPAQPPRRTGLFEARLSLGSLRRSLRRAYRGRLGCTHKLRLLRQSLGAANDVSGLRRMLRRSSAAVATSREDHRSRRLDRAIQHRRWGRERDCGCLRQKRAGPRKPARFASRQCEGSFRRRVYDGVAPGREDHRTPRSDPAVQRRRSGRAQAYQSQ